MDFYKNIGGNIKRLLQESKMKQIELAKKIGVSKQVMSKITRGKKAIVVDELQLIANELNVTVDELLRGDAYIDQDELMLKNLLEKIKNKDTRKTLLLVNKIIDTLIDMESMLEEEYKDR